MAKTSRGVRLNDETIKRLERIAQIDRRSLSNVIEMCIEEYLPTLEVQLENKTNVLPHSRNEQPRSIEPKRSKPKHVIIRGPH
jgi:predicted DNA-binding protein